MTTLLIEDVDPELIKRVEELAGRDGRTPNEQVLYILECYLETGGFPARSVDDERMERIQRILDGEDWEPDLDADTDGGEPDGGHGRGCGCSIVR